MDCTYIALYTTGHNVPLIEASHTCSSILKSHTCNAMLATFLHDKPTIIVTKPQFTSEYDSSRQLWGVLFEKHDPMLKTPCEQTAACARFRISPAHLFFNIALLFYLIIIIVGKETTFFSSAKIFQCWDNFNLFPMQINFELFVCILVQWYALFCVI